ncbi:MAG: aldolase catalytic domain-containing protein [Candidatus Brocadiaceae bacterium]|nr:aldolase catalytic domain-containing protein [Candidatus Brocadiaceae bacterium]
MKKEQISRLSILDCTVRDGGYVNNWYFDKKLVRELYRALSKSGVDYVEIGFRSTERYFDRNKYGLWKFSAEEDIYEATNNISGARLAVMADYGKAGPEDFCKAKESMIDLVRIATHKDTVSETIKLLEQIKQKGYRVSLNAMGYTNYAERERNNLIDMLKAANIDIVFVADSYGSLFPEQIQPIFEPLLCIPGIKVGFHPHNNLQMAFANTLEAIRCGVHFVDSTVFGMGRGAGNLPTEILISYFERFNNDKYNSIPVLNIIDRYFTSLQEKNKWGYQLSFMLSGIFQCHPNYAKALIDMKEYTMEDIWKVMDYINKRDPVGFSKDLLEEIINGGMIGGVTNNKTFIPVILHEKKLVKNDTVFKVPYIDRHKGSDVLILANGPSLKQCRPQIEEFITKYQPIVMGANYLGGLFNPRYHAFNNKRRFIQYIDGVFPESQLMIGQYIPGEMIREYTDRQYEFIFYKDIIDADFEIEDGVIQSNCRTISVLLMGVAIVMGAKRIFAAGMDGYVGIDACTTFHFYTEQDEKEEQDMIMERHRWCQKFIEQIDQYLIAREKEGIHILTPTSYKAFYKGISNYI